MSARASPHTGGPAHCTSRAQPAPRSPTVSPGAARCPVSRMRHEEAPQEYWLVNPYTHQEGSYILCPSFHSSGARWCELAGSEEAKQLRYTRLQHYRLLALCMHTLAYDGGGIMSGFKKSEHCETSDEPVARFTYCYGHSLN